MSSVGSINAKPFIRFIKDWLVINNCTQAELAMKVGLLPAQLSRLLANKVQRVHISTVEKFAETLGYSVPELIELVSSTNTSNIELDILPAFANETENLISIKNHSVAQVRIYSDRLPSVKGSFFGRKEELKLLSEAWAGNDTHIIQFIASGGTGKTKLIRHWLDLTEPENVVAWSFYSQGSSDDKQTSATPFFSHAFEVLSADKHLETDFSSPEAKGEYLARLLNQQRCVLVLDGLEPMQYVDKANRGELKDRSLRALLKHLAGSNTGLCIITTRIAVHELCDRTHVVSHDLHNLALEDGVQLLESLGVKGRKNELEQAATEYSCHALALSLLGNLLRIRYQGDVHKSLILKGLVTTSKNKENQHAFKVMQAYAEYFAGQTELALLSLLGLFDHPIEIEVLRVLWEAQIPELTAGIDEGDWWEAIESLRHEYQLLAERVGGEELDCHPLIREYFGKRLEEGQPKLWRAAHTCLYEYYKNLPEKEFPDTLEEMQPLFHAVAHGCRAGLYEQVLGHIYWQRIQRAEQNYHVKILGAFNDDLSLLSHFFEVTWSKPISILPLKEQAILLSWVALRLQFLGRVVEALEVAQISFFHLIKLGEWDLVAGQAYNLSELHLIIGNLDLAAEHAKCSLKYADQVKNLLWSKSSRSILAHILSKISAENNSTAMGLFEEAERIQNKMEPEYYYLYSVDGYQYCDLLLSEWQIDSVLERLDKIGEWTSKNSWLLDNSLNHLIYGKAYMLMLETSMYQHQRGSNSIDEKALWYFNKSIEGFRKNNNNYYLCLGLLGRSQFYRSTQNYNNALADLTELYSIAEGSNIKLSLVDFYLESSYCLLDELIYSEMPVLEIPKNFDVNEVFKRVVGYIEKAELLINLTGFHLRDIALANLKKQMTSVKEVIIYAMDLQNLH